MLNMILGFGTFGMNELLIIALIVLLLFGGKKIPELMKGLGKGVKSFKEGINDVQNEVNKAVNDDDLTELNRKREEQNKNQG